MHLKFFKSKFTNLSLSSEYFLFSLVIISTIFIISTFYYCYQYSLSVSHKNVRLKQVAESLEEEINNIFEANKNILKFIGTKTPKELRTKLPAGDRLNTAASSVAKQFNEELNKISKKSIVSFILVDEQCNVVLKSTNITNKVKANLCKQTNISVKSIMGENGYLTEPFIIETIQYSYYRKMKNHSNIIFTGFDTRVLERELHQQIFPRLIEFIFIGLFCTILLYFFRKKIITPISELSKCALLISKGKINLKIPRQNSVEMYHLAKALVMVKHYIKRNEVYRKELELANEIIKTSADAREDFIKSINQELMYPLKEILIYTEVLRKNILDKEAIKCIEKIREAVQNIKSKTSSSLHLSYFDFNAIIQQALQINLKISFLKNIELKTNLTNNIPLMYGDALKLKQIVVELIAKAIENSPENQEVKVSTKILSKDSISSLQVIIKDQGFGLSETEMQRIQDSIGWNDENHLFINMEDQFIEKFVNMHHGTFQVENKIHQGRTVILMFPLLEEKDFISEKEKNNIYYFHPK